METAEINKLRIKCMFQAIPIDEICRWIGFEKEPIIVPTLGRLSFITVSCHKVSVYNFEGPGVKANNQIITADIWDYLVFMINNMPAEMREKTSKYKKMYRILFQYRPLAPVVAAVSRFYCEKNGLEK